LSRKAITKNREALLKHMHTCYIPVTKILHSTWTGRPCSKKPKRKTISRGSLE